MNAPLKNDLYLRALAREDVERTPVWVMRQAGRYLPEYLAVRKKAGDFMTLCSTPDLACEVTLQPIDRFDLDAAILFSDILTIPDAMGLGLHFETGRRAEVRAPGPEPGRRRRPARAGPVRFKLRYVTDAVSTIRRELDGRVPLIGFSGSPWTLATYMVEGGGSKDFSKVKGLLFSDPATLHAMLEKTADAVTLYLNAQVEAGAQALMVFDTWGGVLSPANYREFSLAYMQRIVDGLTREADGRRVPVVLFTKNGGAWLDLMADTGCDGLGVDWTTDLATARALVGERVALQGNLDPSVLYGSPDSIRANVRRVLDSHGPGPGHVFNLGHGIHQHVNPEHLGVMVEAVREMSAR